MASSKRGRRVVAGSVLAVGLALAIIRAVPVSAQQAGTTLMADNTATGHWTQTFGWSISKSVSPDTWTLLPGETGSSQYTVAVDEDAVSDEAHADGQICVTNGGSLDTENLQIMDVVQYKLGAGPFQDYASAPVDTSSKPVLSPGDSYCYPSHVTFAPVGGAAYRSVARITITNHAGWMPAGNHCSGPAPCPFGPSPKADFGLPGAPDVMENGTITVSDTNGGWWSFSDSGGVTYVETFTCDEPGTHTNVATIVETGQSASASVLVSCDGHGQD